jgi:hypothetical protein
VCRGTEHEELWDKTVKLESRHLERTLARLRTGVQVSVWNDAVDGRKLDNGVDAAIKVEQRKQQEGAI